MDKYLTAKATPGKMVLLAENTAALALAAVLMSWGFIAVVGFMQDGFMPLAHTLMALIAIPFVLLLSWLLERKRARIHARAIAGTMCVSKEAGVSLEELEKITGVRDLAKVIARLTAKGMICNVLVVRDIVRTADSDIRQATCAYCGASLTYQGERIDHCPSCGSGVIKY